MSRLTPEEWRIVEHLAECHSMMGELDGLDFARSDVGIQQLQDMIFALPTKRAAIREANEKHDEDT